MVGSAACAIIVRQRTRARRSQLYGVGANAAEMERLASPVVVREPEL